MSKRYLHVINAELRKWGNGDLIAALGKVQNWIWCRIPDPPHAMPDPIPSPARADAEAPKRLPVLLRRAWYGLNQAFRQRISHLGLTPDQFSILRWLSEGDPQGLTQRALTDLMASDPNTITSTLTRMEKSGLVTRSPHESDKRANRVKLEPGGRRAFEKARVAAMDLQERVLAVLPAGRRAKFLDELQTIADSCAATLEKTPLKRRTRSRLAKPGN
jgi:DNA-binding MarR family transcriptional regulator